MSIHEECGGFGVMATKPTDIVIGAPDSGLDAALGFSHEAGIPYGIGLIKNKYIGRTFISPGQSARLDGTKIKLAAVEESIKGKRVILVDDSIVRGNTMGRVVKLLRDAGAAEVHVRISSPPFLHPCYYGKAEIHRYSYQYPLIIPMRSSL